jgi:4-hydroxy 2-oxovalerate aldolase
MIILDCTFRDGGYYNNWKFSKDALNQYIHFIKNNPISVIEIGFRFLKKEIFYGPYAFSSEIFLKSLKLPSKKKISVMINAKDYFEDFNLINKYFLKQKHSSVDIVRIAVNYDEYIKCKKITQRLKKLGYQIGLNLMKGHNLNFDLCKKIFKEVNSWKTVDVLYFADSLGCMEPNDVIELCNIFKNHWKKDFGIHAHNNKGLALLNTLSAANHGAAWIDSTILGMGRGAGNVSTESLLIELNYKKKIGKISFSDLSQFYFLKNKYNWGYNPFYHYSSVYKIHPSYVQSLIEDERYNKDIFSTLEHLGKLNTTNFDPNLLEPDYKLLYNNQYRGDTNINHLFDKKQILIIGSGKTIEEYKDHIEQFIRSQKLVTISLNKSDIFDLNYIDFIAISHLGRINIEINDILKYKKKLIAPPSIINKYNISKNLCVSYGLKINNKIKSYKNYCELPSPLVLNYVLLFLTKTKARQIYLAGIDGFNDDNKNREINNFLSYFKKSHKNISLKNITPTNFENLENMIVY